MAPLSELADGLEPHDHIAPAVDGAGYGVSSGRGEGVPGVVGDWGGWVSAIPVPQPQPSQDPYLDIFLR